MGKCSPMMPPPVDMRQVRVAYVGPDASRSLRWALISALFSAAIVGLSMIAVILAMGG